MASKAAFSVFTLSWGWIHEAFLLLRNNTWDTSLLRRASSIQPLDFWN